nr:uncharacterized protein K02A2.6-like [Nerophis lumbriciformis]
MDLKPPEKLKLSGNVDSNWRTFKQQFQLYMAAMALQDKPDARKVALLLTIAGPHAIEVYNTFVFDNPDEKNKLDVVIEKFDAHCSPKKNETYERYVFRSRVQAHGESFDSFVTDLRLKAQTCYFATLKDSMIRDQIVCGIEDKKVRERLLRETELSLENAIKICHAAELSQMHVKTFGEMASTAAISVGGDNVYVVSRGWKSQPAQQKSDVMYQCKRCGSQHKPKQCPAFGKQCSKCYGKNHFAKQCFAKGKPCAKKEKSVNVVEDTDLGETFFVGLVNSENKTEEVVNAVEKDKWIAPLQINGTRVNMKLDTGAKANLINMSDIKELREKPKIHRTTVALKDYNGRSIDSLGTCKLRVTVKGKVHYLLFSVVTEERESILGDKACEVLGLVKRVYLVNTDVSAQKIETDSIVQNYAGVFTGFGALPFTYKIQLKEQARPVVHAARRVPAALKERLKKELDRMTTLGVIKKIEEPTDWVNSMVCVKKKNGDLRICMDPKDLNENIKREHYQIPKREEIASEMAGAKYFSKLDASNGFWQIKLDENSSKYCTFNTPFGRYCFQRLPFGIKSASEIFHRAMEHIIEGLEGVRAYIDDIAVWGRTAKEHNERLTKVLERVQQYGLKLNKNKCQFGVSEIIFLGDKLSAHGVQPDDEKIHAIQRMPSPTDKTGVQRILGVVNYIGKFIPNLAVKTSCIRELLHNDTEFKWTSRHENEWQRLKETLTTAPVLTFFDPTKKTKVSTDASKDGLGGVLLQADDEHWKPVAYASRSMTQAECRYAQIEKECLGLAYGLQSFHNYVYGLPTFTVETDHRPLVSIIKKNLNDMTPRIQRFMMKMQPYDFQLIYTPGKHLILADALSRAPMKNSVSATEEDVQNHVNMVSATLPVSDIKSQQIAEETAKDEELQRVITNMQNGWPPRSSPRFFHVRGELSVVDGLLLKRNRIVIPQTLRQDILQRIHEGHLGIEKCKRRARDTVYWPGINKDIDNMIGRCATCQKYRNKQTKEPMILPEVLTAPWQKVGMDLFYLKGKEYVVVIDYYSNFPEMALLSSTSSNCVITHVKSIFARHGIPHTVVSDNGPCFNSKEWQQFAKHYDFRHVTSSPLYAQSNGKAEKGVHILKQLLKKAVDSNSDPYLALLSYRATPLECGLSPSELLMNRKLRTTLPSMSTPTQSQKVQRKLKQQKLKQKSFYDKAAKSLPSLSPSDTVRIEGPDGWKTKATVLQETSPRSYTVRSEEGQILRRNRRSLLRVPETVPNQETAESEVSSTPTVSNQATAESEVSSTPTDCETMPIQHMNEDVTDDPEPVLRRSTRQIKKPVNDDYVYY